MVRSRPMALFPHTGVQVKLVFHTTNATMGARFRANFDSLHGKMGGAAATPGNGDANCRESTASSLTSLDGLVRFRRGRGKKQG